MMNSEWMWGFGPMHWIGGLLFALIIVALVKYIFLK